MMHCAECGEAMTRREDGAWELHCNGYGYWYNEKPLERDRWWSVKSVRGWYFYPTVFWPKQLKPVLPINS